jgi:hypothetical protein
VVEQSAKPSVHSTTPPVPALPVPALPPPAPIVKSPSSD